MIAINIKINKQRGLLLLLLFLNCDLYFVDPEWHPDQSQSHGGIKFDTVLVPVNWKARKSLGN